MATGRKPDPHDILIGESVLSPEVIRELCEQLEERLNRRRTIDEETHKAHHKWIGAAIANQERWADIKIAVLKSVLTWAAIGVCGGVAIAIVMLAQYWIRSLSSGGP